MLFRIDYSVDVSNVPAAQERFATTDEKWDGLNLIGRWHEAGNKGFMIVEAEDMVSVGTFCHQWSDLCDLNAVPLMTDEQVGQILSA